MADNHAARMRIQDYNRYVDLAAEARTAASVARIRAELMQRWPGDPRARDLIETLYAHQVTLPDSHGDGARPISKTSRAEALRWLPESAGERSVTLFTQGSLSVKMCAPCGVDPQTPHTCDGIYVVAEGSGSYYDGEARRPVSPGDLLFAPAGSVHRFENCTDDFATWVILVDRESGEAMAREVVSASVISRSARTAPALRSRSTARAAGARAALATPEGGRA